METKDLFKETNLKIMTFYDNRNNNHYSKYDLVFGQQMMMAVALCIQSTERSKPSLNPSEYTKFIQIGFEWK